MKKIFLVGILCILCEIASHGQSVYSMQNLQQSSPENLNIYLTLAKKQKKSGAIITATGAITAVAGFAVFALSYEGEEFLGYNTGTDIGGWMTVLGTGATLAGLPIWISGSVKVKRIKQVMSNPAEVYFELAPCSFKDFIAHNNQTGITIRLRF